MIESQRLKLTKEAHKKVKNYLSRNEKNDQKIVFNEKITNALKILDVDSSCSSVSGGLRSLGGLCAIEAVQSFLFDDEEKAYVNLKKSYIYELEAIKILISLRIKQNNLHSLFLWNVNEIIDLLVLAVVFNDKSTLNLLSLLLEIVEIFDVDRESYFDMNYLIFTKNLARITLGNNVDVKDLANESTYGQLFLHWNNTEKFGEKLKDALDYHLGLAMHEGDYFLEHNRTHDEWIYDCPFDNITGMAIPFEIVALYKVRLRLKLDWPIVNHAFLPNELTHKFTSDSNLKIDSIDNVLTKVKGRALHEEDLLRSLKSIKK